MDDFTTGRYRILLALAHFKYPCVSYSDIPWDSRFILWRHDVDASLNRAVRLAELEFAQGVHATYFVNLRSPFYNPLESPQSVLVRAILGFGHRLGLHFDANHGEHRDRKAVEARARREIRWLSEEFECDIDAISFHNPTAEHLSWSDEHFGGVVNCYSDRLMTGVAYCSDSNGYWRHQRLHDVLASESAPDRIQVLTHPEWWQDESMPPRERVFRSVRGRARRTLQSYDDLLASAGRANLSGRPEALVSLGELLSDEQEVIELLWESRLYDPLLAVLTDISHRIDSVGLDSPDGRVAVASRETAREDPADLEAACVKRMEELVRRVQDATWIPDGR